MSASRVTNRWKDRHGETDRQTETDRETDTETDRHKNKQLERQTDIPWTSMTIRAPRVTRAPASNRPRTSSTISSI